MLLEWFRRAENITHVHCHFGTNSTTVALFVRLLGGPPYSFTVHGPEEWEKPEFIAMPEKKSTAPAFVRGRDLQLLVAQPGYVRSGAIRLATGDKLQDHPLRPR